MEDQKTVTKRALALRVSAQTGCKQGLTARMVESLIEALKDSLVQGNRIEIRGFGVLQVKDMKPKPAARNPRTGEVVFVPARRKPHFKPGKALKEGLREPSPAIQDEA